MYVVNIYNQRNEFRGWEKLITFTFRQILNMHATFPMTNTVLFITLVHLQGPFSEATAGTNRTNACLVIAKSVVQPHICIL